MQHFRLVLACGHTCEVSAVDEHEGAPYVPNYVGKVIPGKPNGPVGCCDGDHTVREQRKIPRLTGKVEEVTPAAAPEPEAAPAAAPVPILRQSPLG